MVEKIRLGEQWYILATSSPADERRRVLKHNDLFAMFDRFGDIQPIGLGEEGIYHGDTCFLSHHELLIEGVRPMYLNSTVRDDNGLFVIELMNPDLHPDNGALIAKGDLHIFRAKLLWNNACYEHVRIVNYGLVPIEVTMSICALLALCTSVLVAAMLRNVQPGSHEEVPEPQPEYAFAESSAD